jgi:hypothetical protein
MRLTRSFAAQLPLGLGPSSAEPALVHGLPLACGTRGRDAREKRMARPVSKQFRRANLSSLHQRIRSQGRTLAKMEIRASRAS